MCDYSSFVSSLLTEFIFKMTSDFQNRKLGPIYDAIDSRNYKAAIKLCDKKDVSKIDIIKALKAHALERIGHSDEALELCREVQANCPTDEPTLHTMSLVYRNSGEYEEIHRCYDAAVRKDPLNESLSIGLFGCLVSQQIFSKAQQLAMKMSKLFNKPEYMIWAATCMTFEVETPCVFSP
jgi:N-terminal acetyltransferase B complex non-catalytic subunit